jgi:hypothetical protein
MLAYHALPSYALRESHPWNGLTAVSGVACLQGRQPAAVFYPLGYPIPMVPSHTHQVSSYSVQKCCLYLRTLSKSVKQLIADFLGNPSVAWHSLVRRVLILFLVTVNKCIYISLCGLVRGRYTAEWFHSTLILEDNAYKFCLILEEKKTLL